MRMRRRFIRPMMKSISNILKTDKERYKVPRKVQDVIPIKRIWPDGIFLVGSKYAKSWKFTDINYLDIIRFFL